MKKSIHRESASKPTSRAANRPRIESPQQNGRRYRSSAAVGFRETFTCMLMKTGQIKSVVVKGRGHCYVGNAQSISSFMRKVIQLVKIPSTLSSGGSLYALCDDGSIWYCEITRGGMRESILKWERVPVLQRKTSLKMPNPYEATQGSEDSQRKSVNISTTGPSERIR